MCCGELAHLDRHVGQAQGFHEARPEVAGVVCGTVERDEVVEFRELRRPLPVERHLFRMPGLEAARREQPGVDRPAPQQLPLVVARRVARVLRARGLRAVLAERRAVVADAGDGVPLRREVRVQRDVSEKPHAPAVERERQVHRAQRRRVEQDVRRLADRVRALTDQLLEQERRRQHGDRAGLDQARRREQAADLVNEVARVEDELRTALAGRPQQQLHRVRQQEVVIEQELEVVAARLVDQQVAVRTGLAAARVAHVPDARVFPLRHHRLDRAAGRVVADEQFEVGMGLRQRAGHGHVEPVGPERRDQDRDRRASHRVKQKKGSRTLQPSACASRSPSTSACERSSPSNPAARMRCAISAPNRRTWSSWP